MKIRKDYLVSTFLTSLICIPVFGEVEPPLPEDPATLLIGQANPVLVDIEPLTVVIVPPESYQRALASLWSELRTKVERRLRKAGIEIFVPEPGITYKLPISTDLKIHTEMLKLNEPQQDVTASGDSDQHVLRIQTSLSRAVRLSPRGKFSFKADVWKVKPVMQIASGKSISDVVTDVALKQVDTFITCHLTANSQRAGSADTKTSETVSPTTPQKSPKQLGRQTPATYKYVASKNSKVFHNADCRWAKQIASKNLINYSTRQEAIDAGKRPCKRCKP